MLTGVAAAAAAAAEEKNAAADLLKEVEFKQLLTLELWHSDECTRRMTSWKIFDESFIF